MKEVLLLVAGFDVLLHIVTLDESSENEKLSQIILGRKLSITKTTICQNYFTAEWIIIFKTDMLAVF